MSRIKQIFEKQGGMNLIQQYAQSNALFTAICEFLLLGKSRTALELLRLATHLKVKQKLRKRYSTTLKKFDSEYVASDSCFCNKVWVCWLQGMENAPLIVQKCYDSLVRNMPNRDITLITADNILEYVEFPDYIIEKWHKNQITNTHLTDLLRLELLIKYGGMWLDATVYCSSSDIPNYFFDSDLFMFQNLKPGRDGHSHITSSWLISAKSNNKILMAVRYLLYEYWKDYNSLIDYFLLHDFMAIVLEYYEQDWNVIVPRDNATPHILLLRLFEPYDENIWNAVKEQTPFHKLAYKRSEEEFARKGTYYDVIFN